MNFSYYELLQVIDEMTDALSTPVQATRATAYAVACAVACATCRFYYYQSSFISFKSVTPQNSAGCFAHYVQEKQAFIHYDVFLQEFFFLSRGIQSSPELFFSFFFYGTGSSGSSFDIVEEKKLYSDFLTLFL